MRTLLAVILGGIMSSILFSLFEHGPSRKDIREILEDDRVIFQQPLGV
jgi:hypothetical protein